VACETVVANRHHRLDGTVPGNPRHRHDGEAGR
jgi:hypothetical protein